MRAAWQARQLGQVNLAVGEAQRPVPMALAGEPASVGAKVVVVVEVEA